MITLAEYSPLIRALPEEVEEWFRPVLDKGRGAAFVDTGFIRALVDTKDQYHTSAKRVFESISNTNIYTTSLVLAEIMRQVAKGDADRYRKSQWFGKCEEYIYEKRSIFVCYPPEEAYDVAFALLKEGRQVEPKLDLCDAMTICVLDHAKHKRVLGFDRHLGSFGAQLEP